MSGGMFSAPSPPPQLVQMAAQGPWGGPTYSYRGARIECGKGEYVCGLLLEGHRLDRLTFGMVGTSRRKEFAAGISRPASDLAPEPKNALRFAGVGARPAAHSLGGCDLPGVPKVPAPRPFATFGAGKF
jgi:hypothetical protein